MSEFRDPASTSRTIAGIEFRDDGSVLRAVAAVDFRDDGNVLRSSAATISASAYPTAVAGNGSSMSDIYVTTNAATVTVIGGVPPYSFSWAPDAIDWEAVNPSAQTTGFRSPPLSPGETETANFVCTVTDANAATADTNSVHATGRNLA